MIENNHKKIELPPFKTKLKSIGQYSKGILVPAKYREDYGVDDDTEYWVEITLNQTA